MHCRRGGRDLLRAIGRPDESEILLSPASPEALVRRLFIQLLVRATTTFEIVNWMLQVGSSQYRELLFRGFARDVGMMCPG